MANRQFTIIGGGPAGLTAAYELTRHGQTPLVLEKGAMVGGISRTENYKGYHFDMGGHRFFTKAEEVNTMWHEVLQEEFLRRPRLSRIYYRGKFFYYPLKPMDTLKRLGPIEATAIAFSYLRWQLFPYKQENTFEEWVTNRFGKRLFETFFKTYTEKVWGISCKELKAEWAAQRIKDLSVKSIIVSMFFKPKKTIKTLIEEFDYPKLGPGMMWNAVKDRIKSRGGEVRLDCDVVRVLRDGNRITGVVVRHSDGAEETVGGTDFVNSMPLTEFIKRLDPPPAPEVLEAAKQLKHRDFLTVCLILNKAETFPDNWIYIHDPRVKVGRIQNFKNWSPHMVPDASKTSLGLEYFCNVGDETWRMSDAELVELGKKEIDKIGLAKYEDVIDGCVCRVPFAYPVYDEGYEAHLNTLKTFIDNLANCRTVGRSGLHRYNNQDHSMLAGMYAARNMLLGEKHDLWSVNADQEYHETVSKGERPEGRNTRRVEAPAEPAPGSLAVVLAKFDRVAAGAAWAALCGIGLMILTLILTVHGGPDAGRNLGRLGAFFPGYHGAGWPSVLLGLVYGAAAGFVLGWLFAVLTNVVNFIVQRVLYRRAKAYSVWNLLEYI